MYLFAIEELARANMQEREAEARRIATQAALTGGGRPIRWRLARTLVRTGLCLDRSAGELVPRVTARGRC